MRLFLAGEHDIMQKVFAGQEEEERGTQVEIEVRAFCRKETKGNNSSWTIVQRRLGSYCVVVCHPFSTHPAASYGGLTFAFFFSESPAVGCV